jgi:signal transduction histidine kinase
MADRVTQLIRSRQELLADFSHELRTPLARIRVALDLAAEGTSDLELQREALGEISEHCAELERCRARSSRRTAEAWWSRALRIAARS